jgi:hypothetical protein
MKARNIWTRRLGSDRRFASIGLVLFKDAGSGRRRAKRLLFSLQEKDLQPRPRRRINKPPEPDARSADHHQAQLPQVKC